MSETITKPTHPCEPLTHQHDPDSIAGPQMVSHGSVDEAQSLAAKDPLSPTCKQNTVSTSSSRPLVLGSSSSPGDELATEDDFANRAFQAVLAKTVGRLGFTGNEVDDIVQDTNIVLTKRTRLGRIRRGALPTFAFGTAMRCCMAYRRRSRGRLVLGSFLDKETWDDFLERSLVAPSNPERYLRAARDLALVRAVVGAMPKRMRQVAEAAFFDELDISEIQSALGVSYRTVTTNLCKARSRCKAHLEFRRVLCTGPRRRGAAKNVY